MSEGKMELRELSHGRVLHFEPATGRTWQLTSWDRWELIEEPNQQEEEEDDSDEEDDGEHRSMSRVDVDARGWRHYHGPQCTTAMCRCALSRLPDPPIWRDLLRAGAAPETTQGTIPTVSPIPDTRGTVRFIGQRNVASEGEQPDEKPEPDYRSEAAWE